MMRRMTGKATHVAFGVVPHDGVGVTLRAPGTDFLRRGATEAEDAADFLGILQVQVSGPVAPFTALPGFVRRTGHRLLLAGVT